MKYFCAIIFVVFSYAAIAQSFQTIGTGPIGNASEIDLEYHTTSNTLFAAIVDTDNGNRATVKRWDVFSQTWLNVGLPGFSGTNVFDIQLALSSGTAPVVCMKRVTLISTTNYETLELYKFNSVTSTWESYGTSELIVTEHNYDFSLRTNPSGHIFLSFVNEPPTTLTQGLITLKWTTSPTAFSQLGGSSGNILEDGNGQIISSFPTGMNSIRTVHSDADVGSNFLKISNFNASTWTFPYNLPSSSNGTRKVKMEKLTTTGYPIVWINDLATDALNYTFDSETSLSSVQTIASSTLGISDFDFDVKDNIGFVFYRSGTTANLRKLSTLSGTLTSLSFGSGISLAPNSSTSFSVETIGSDKVIFGYINGGQAFVKENRVSEADGFSGYSLCEGAAFTNVNFNAISIAGGDLDYTYTATISSQNTAIIPNSAISSGFNPGSSNTGFFVNIGTTNDVASQTIVDLQVEVFNNGISIGSGLIQIVVNPKPNIVFNFITNTRCQTANPLSLIGKASPVGGSWFGDGIIGTQFVPNLAPIGASSAQYSVSNAYGCQATEAFEFIILPSPDLTININNTACNLNNGSASVAIAGGQAPYDIVWSNNQTTSLIDSLPADQYFVQVEDANGCKRSAAAMVGSLGLNQSLDNVQSVACYGGNTGFLEVSISGAVGDVTYLWSNGDTGPIADSLVAGSYQLVITDSSGCVSIENYIINQNSPLAQVIDTLSSPTNCSLSNATVNILASGGTPPYSIGIFDINNNFVAPGEDFVFLGTGAYFTEIIDAKGCVHTDHFEVNMPSSETPNFALNSMTPANCTPSGSLDIVPISPGSYSYNWSNGATTEDISTLIAGVYSLEVTNSLGCTGAYSYEVESVLPPVVEICLVTVDTVFATNQVVWEKPVTTVIDHFNIYRESAVGGTFMLIGSVPYASISIYTDLNASPFVRSWKYKISSVDACGNESELSEEHKTIHLAISLGLGQTINLAWDEYIGVTYPSFEIHRRTLTNGWEVIATVPNTLFSYSDTPPTTDSLLYAIVFPTSTCSAEKAQDFNTIRSNREKGSQLSSGEPSSIEENNFGIAIYPNPFETILSISNVHSEMSYSIYDLQGKLIYKGSLNKGTTDLKFDCPKGVYQLVLSKNGVSENIRVVNI
jgi:trimeric autotransporter adhesin